LEASVHLLRFPGLIQILMRLLNIFISTFFLVWSFPALAETPSTRLFPKQTVRADSLIDGFADSAFEAVVRSRTLPRKEQVQYFSEITRYGFRNLFSNTSYNRMLPYNQQVNPKAELFIRDYMRKHARHLDEMKNWGQPYFNLIETVFDQYGLPRELKYVAVIESNLKTSATSHMGAAGPWQFMPQTARTYGMEVSAYRDDRRDYLKSTHAASRLLLDLYRQYRDWLLVMAAYNAGPGRVDGAIRKSGSRDFWQLEYHLPEETRTYVKRFIATHYIMEGTGGVTTAGNGGDARIQADSGTRVDVEVLPITGKYNSLVIARTLAMDILDFNRFNRGFDAAMAGEGRYDLRLPPEKMQRFIANRYAILNESVQLLIGGSLIPAKTEKTKPAKKTREPRSR
jgi:membrane-bound lytic murein transglycosylase D